MNNISSILLFVVFYHINILSMQPSESLIFLTPVIVESEESQMALEEIRQRHTEEIRSIEKDIIKKIVLDSILNIIKEEEQKRKTEVCAVEMLLIASHGMLHSTKLALDIEKEKSSRRLARYESKENECEQKEQENNALRHHQKELTTTIAENQRAIIFLNLESVLLKKQIQQQYNVLSFKLKKTTAENELLRRDLQRAQHKCCCIS